MEEKKRTAKGPLRKESYESGSGVEKRSQEKMLTNKTAKKSAIVDIAEMGRKTGLDKLGGKRAAAHLSGSAERRKITLLV